MIIGLRGKAGSGKNTVGEIIHDIIGPRCKLLALADPMKETCKSLFGFTDDQLWGPSEMRNQVDPRWGFSPRTALQLLGTEWGRRLDEDVWCKILFNRMEALRNAVPTPSNAHASMASYGLSYFDTFVVTDVRFPNEVSYIKARGGFIWHIDRPEAPMLDAIAASHESETSIDTGTDGVDVIIDNHRDIAHLRGMVRIALDTCLALPVNTQEDPQMPLFEYHVRGPECFDFSGDESTTKSYPIFAPNPTT